MNSIGFVFVFLTVYGLNTQYICVESMNASLQTSAKCGMRSCAVLSQPFCMILILQEEMKQAIASWKRRRNLWEGGCHYPSWSGARLNFWLKKKNVMEHLMASLSASEPRLCTSPTLPKSIEEWASHLLEVFHIPKLASVLAVRGVEISDVHLTC